MKKDASRFSPKGVLFHRTFFTAPFYVQKYVPLQSHMQNVCDAKKTKLTVVYCDCSKDDGAISYFEEKSL